MATVVRGRGRLRADGQRSNLLLWSEELDNARWAELGTPAPTVTANEAVAPDGTLTADRVQWDAGTATLQQANIAFTAGTTYTLSVYAEAVSGSGTFRLGYFDGTAGASSSDKTATDGEFTRHTLTFTPANSGSGNISITRDSGNGAGDFYFWGAQLNRGPIALHYMKTTDRAR